MQKYIKKWGLLVLNLFLLFLIFLFVLNTLRDRGLFEYIGIDFRLWYSTGSIIRLHGISSIYDSSLQSFYQRELYEGFSISNYASMPFWPLPLTYLPIFTLPMYFLSFFTPVFGFVIWITQNLIIGYLYLLTWIKRAEIVLSRYKVLVVLISLPFLLNIILTNVNLILLILVGELVIGLKNGKEELTGIFLAGLLLKPQNLILVIPGLIYLRKWKVLKGFVIASAIILLISVVLVGKNGIIGLVDTIINWPDQLGDSGMTLIAFSANMKKFLPDILVKVITIFFYVILIVNLGKVWVWNKKANDDQHFVIFFYITLLTTFSLSPHGNVHMAMMIIPLGLYLYSLGIVKSIAAFLWIYIPLFLFLIIGMISVGLAHIIGGMAMLFVNILMSSKVGIDTIEQDL